MIYMYTWQSFYIDLIVFKKKNPGKLDITPMNRGNEVKDNEHKTDRNFETRG